MKDLLIKIKNSLLYGGISKKEYDQVHDLIAEANYKSLKYWTCLVSMFWIYCLLMSLKAEDYAMCRPAYAVALGLCIFTYVSARLLVPRFPKTLPLLTCFFRLSLLGGGIGIAVCQWNVRSLTLVAVAIIAPSVFIDNTVSSLVVHCTALVLYILLGHNTINPEIYSWGLNNYMLFSVFGLLIGNAINKARFERFVYAEYEKELAEMQMRYVNYDRLTGLKNRHAYEDMLLQLEKEPGTEYCVIMADINGLKKANDTIGHKAGDELITGTSECLSTAFEGIDTVYRIGGDEFCIILLGSLEKARLCLAQLDDKIASWHGDYINSLSVSTGVASSKDHEDIDAVFIEADQNMYESKRDYYQRTGADRRKH